MRILVLFLSLFALIGCSDIPAETAPVDDALPASAEETSTNAVAAACYSDGIAGLVGQPTAALESHPDKPSDVRMIGPGMLVTQEYLPNRLNVHTNKAGQIIRLECG